MFVKTNVWPKKCLAKKNCLRPENFGFKKILVENILGQMNYESEKNIGSKQFLVQQNLGSNNILGPQKFWVKTKFEAQKISDVSCLT